MRTLRIVADSSADVQSMEGLDFACAPLKIITTEREFVDDANLDVAQMVEFLGQYKGKSKSSCPNASDYLHAFGDADDVICVTITSGLSGSYNAAYSAKQLYEEDDRRRVFVLDSLSAGPELRLILARLRDYVQQKLPFEQICDKIKAYREKTGLLFMLRSVKNFANNGRISPLVAKIIGVAGICIVGKASEQGTLEITDKCRGQNQAMRKIVEKLQELGEKIARVYISHCQNEVGAQCLKTMLNERFEQASVEIFDCRGLCSFYAEKGGLLVGYETV